MIYLDTSVLGAIFFRESGATNLVARLESQRKAKLMISAWTLTEMASIGGIKQRKGAIDAETRQQAIANFQRCDLLSLARLREMDGHGGFHHQGWQIAMPVKSGLGRGSHS